MSGVVVLGDVMWDVVALADGPLERGSDTPARITAAGGGGGANVAAWLAAAGVPAALVARVGDDGPGRATLAGPRAAGVDVRAAVDAERPTGTCVVLVEPGGERSMLPDPGANAALCKHDLPDDLFAAGGHLHLAGYALLRPGSRAAARAALQRATAAGMTVSVDPSSAAPLRVEPTFLEWVAGAHLLLPNAAEAEVLTGEADPATAARALARHAGEVVVTLGREGALWTDGRRVVRTAAAEPPAAVVDTTGAGDAFAAGLLAARRAGSPPEAQLLAAARLAAEAVARPGARP